MDFPRAPNIADKCKFERREATRRHCEIVARL
jgi:hypothetical protein